VIAVLGTALVMSLTLLLTGFQAVFSVEIQHTLHLVKADGYLVQAGRPGPFLGGSPIPTDIARRAGELDGVKEFAPLIMMPQVTDQKTRADVFIIAAEPGSTLGQPPVTKGQLYAKPGEAVIDARSKLKVGDSFGIAGKRFAVVGTTTGQTWNGGRPSVYMSIKDAQDVMFGGQDVVTAVAVKGAPTNLPDQVTFMTNDVAGKDLRRPLLDVIESITMFRTMLWIVAVAIVGSVVYLSALERAGDFAVFKATGTATADLLGALVVQAIALSVSGSILACGLAYLLRGQFPVTPLLPLRNQLALPVVGLFVGVVASLAALRRAVTVDPALAFGSGGH
jgi:putative ABC transport system permease protein